MQAKEQCSKELKHHHKVFMKNDIWSEVCRIPKQLEIYDSYEVHSTSGFNNDEKQLSSLSTTMAVSQKGTCLVSANTKKMRGSNSIISSSHISSQ